ncbi:MAG: hypothetical protein KGL39_09890 [Patescibacteria group bacterium]|nr:hypothetical protein [Patescibacteria group bacterium]
MMITISPCPDGEFLVKTHSVGVVGKGFRVSTRKEAVSRPVIEWLNKNFHPHVIVVINQTSAELSEGVIAFTTHEYLRD